MSFSHLSNSCSQGMSADKSVTSKGGEVTRLGRRFYLSPKLLLCCFLLMWGVACNSPTEPPPTATLMPTATPMPIIAEQRATPTATPMPSPTPMPTVPPTTIEVWVNLPPAQYEQLEQEAIQFEVEFPNYHVDLQLYQSMESFMPQLMTGEAHFAVMLTAQTGLAQLWINQQIAPMDDFFPPSFQDGFAGVTLQGATTANQLWAISDTAGFHLLLFYNRDLLTTPPSTMDAALETAAQFAETDTPWGLAFNSTDPLWVVPWLTTYNGWLTDDTGQPTFDHIAMETVLTDYQQWHQQPGILPPTTHEAMRLAFERGNLAMMVEGEWALDELPRDATLNWGVVPLPGLSDGQPSTPLVLGRYWAISRHVEGQEAQAAAAFVTFITRPTRQLAWTEQFGLLPTQREALSDPFILTDPYLQASTTQLLAGRGVPMNVNPNTLLQAMRAPLSQLLAGEFTPKEAAAAMQANLP